MIQALEPNLYKSRAGGLVQGTIKIGGKIENPDTRDLEFSKPKSVDSSLNLAGFQQTMKK